MVVVTGRMSLPTTVRTSKKTWAAYSSCRLSHFVYLFVLFWDRVSLCTTVLSRTYWPQPHGGLPASISWVLELKAWATRPGPSHFSPWSRNSSQVCPADWPSVDSRSSQGEKQNKPSQMDRQTEGWRYVVMDGEMTDRDKWWVDGSHVDSGQSTVSSVWG